jgi:hypothetical protein
MQDNGFIRSVEALRRELRGLGAVVEDPAARAPGMADAAAQKKRLEQRLRDAGTPAGDRTDHASDRAAGRKEIRKSASPPPAAADGRRTPAASANVKAARRAYKKWSSE